MTESEFKAQYLPEWKKLTRKDAFVAFLSVLEEEAPSNKLDGKIAGDLLHGASVFLNQDIGWRNVIKLIKRLATESVTPPEPADSFAEPEL